MNRSLFAAAAFMAIAAPRLVTASAQQCCTLAGKWRLTMVLDSASLWKGTPRDSTVSGDVEFGEKFRFFPRDPGEDTMRVEFGRHKLSFKPFWGADLAPEPSTAIVGPGTDNPLSEVLAFVGRSDSIGILLSPRFTHSGFALVGTLSGDSLVTGQWALRGNESRAAGHFKMARRSRR